jgi:hypothetical protein
VLFVEQEHETPAGALRCQLAGGAGRALGRVVGDEIEILDLLGLAVLVEFEIFGDQTGHELAVAVENDGIDLDERRSGAKDRRLRTWLRCRGRVLAVKGQRPAGAHEQEHGRAATHQPCDAQLSRF